MYIDIFLCRNENIWKYHITLYLLLFLGLMNCCNDCFGEFFFQRPHSAFIYVHIIGFSMAQPSNFLSTWRVRKKALTSFNNNVYRSNLDINNVNCTLYCNWIFKRCKSTQSLQNTLWSVSNFGIHFKTIIM